MEIDVNKIKIKNQAASIKKSNALTSIMSVLNKDITSGRKKFNDSKKEKFYNQLGVLFSSGIDLGSSLQILIEEEQNVPLKEMFRQVYKDIVVGASFSEALYKTSQFTDYEYYSIKVGEESGRLQDVLTELTTFFELKVEQRRQLTRALSYPFMVSIVAVGAVVFMLNVVVPMFAGFFQRFGSELPPLTRRVLALSGWFSDHFITVLLLFAALGVLIVYMKKFEWYEKHASLLLLKIPFIGRLVSKIIQARFCHALALLTMAQVPLLDALEMVKKMIGFYPFREAIANVQAYIVKGKHMYEGMEKQKLFDRHLISITKVGEEVNQVGQLYAKLNAQYTTEIKHMTSVLGNMLEPIMIIFVGILVMVILIAMYLPLFQLSTTVA